MSKQETTIQQAELAKFRDYVLEVNRRVLDLSNKYSADQLAWKPDPKSWNMLECIGHLYQTASVYHPRIRKTIEDVRQKDLRQKGDFKPTWFGKKFMSFIVPESTFRLKTFDIFRPSSDFRDTGIIERFLEQQKELLSLLELADGYDIDQTKFASPATRLVRFTIGEGLWLMAIHQLRHIGQAERIAEKSGFPAD